MHFHMQFVLCSHMDIMPMRIKRKCESTYNRIRTTTNADIIEICISLHCMAIAWKLNSKRRTIGVAQALITAYGLQFSTVPFVYGSNSNVTHRNYLWKCDSSSNTQCMHACTECVRKCECVHKQELVERQQNRIRILEFNSDKNFFGAFMCGYECECECE